MSKLSGRPTSGKSLGGDTFVLRGPPSGAERWTLGEAVDAILGTGSACCCEEIDPSDRPCLMCEAIAYRDGTHAGAP